MLDPNQQNTNPQDNPPQTDETAPVRVSSLNDETRANPVTSVKRKRVRRWPWFILGILLILALGAGGGYLGYNAAIDLRRNKEAEAVVTKATEYYMMGVDAQKNQKYGLARSYFEAVIKLDPKFPGASDRLTEVLIAQMATSTPTLAPTPTPTVPTPTPDVRSQDEKLTLAREQYVNKDWDNLFVTIDSLRTIDPNYHAVEVDGMLYMALRFRGIRKIYQEANLEGGIYDLALAEKISPLDSEALGARNAARAYLNAISFWGVDWKKTIELLEQIAGGMPYMRDASGMTASLRYQQAVATEASVLDSQDDPCGATDYYNKAINAGVGNIEPAATAAELKCHPPTKTPTPTIAYTPTPTSEATIEPPPPPPPPVEEQPSPTVEQPAPTVEQPAPSDTPAPAP